MKRALLIGLVVCLTLGIGGCGNTDADKPGDDGGAVNPKDVITLSVGHVVPETHVSHITLGLGFEEYVEKESGGRIDVQVYPNGQLGGERQQVEAVSLGTLDMSIPGSSVMANFDSNYFIFDLPFLFNSLESARATCDSDFGKMVDANLDTLNMINLGYAENGFRYMTNNVRPIKEPKDLKGLKMRTMENPIHMAVFSAFGANPTPMAFGELYTALQQKTVDGQENPIGLIYANKFYEVQKYMSMTGHVYLPCPYIINKSKFESLPEDLQKIVRDGVTYSIKEQRKMFDEENDKMLEEMKSAGLEVYELSNEDKQKFVDAVQPVYKDFEAEYGNELMGALKQYNK